MFRIVCLLCSVGLALSGPSPLRSKEEVEAYRHFLQSTAKGNGFLLSSRALNPGNVWEESGRFEGDIVLDDWQIEGLAQDFAEGRAAYIWPNTKWPSNMVVYDFAAGHFNNAQIDHILSSIGWIEHFTCVRFRRRNSSDRNYVLLTGHRDGCYASVGYWHDRGIHTMNLTPSNPGTGCFNIVTIIHEWLHVLGFFHMQSAYSRDNYVRIQWENIQRGMEYNFEMYGTNLVSNLGLPYEHQSCMHYASHAFSVTGRPTIVALRGHEGVMGQQTFVTHWDWVRLSRHYSCPGAWNTELVDYLEEEVEKNKDLMATPISEDN